MKLRMLTLAVTAIALSAQGVAQQSNDGLERALADLNSGLVATQGAGVNISGDARIRNEWNEGVGGSRKNLDTRFRLNFTANVNESVSAFIGTTYHNTWDGSPAGDAEEGNINQAYLSVNSLFGDGGSWTIGTKHNHVASGRVKGYDDWDASGADDTDTGIWYAHDAGGSNLNIGLLDDQATDQITVELDWGLNIPGMGDVSIAPYYIADRTGGVQGGAGGDNTTLGAEFNGTFLGFGFDADMAKQGDNSASAFGLTLNIDALGAIPGVSGGAVDFLRTTSDQTGVAATSFQTDSPTSWGQAGLNNIAVWDQAETTQFGVSFSPAEGWTGRLARVEADARSEWDITMNHTFGGGVAGWFGYQSNDDTDNTLWMTLGVDF